jgi:hypothetical protein
VNASEETKTPANSEEKLTFEGNTIREYGDTFRKHCENFL